MSQSYHDYITQRCETRTMQRGIEMRTCDLPTEPEWLVTNGKATCSVSRRFYRADFSAQEMEDMIQVAPLAY